MGNVYLYNISQLIYVKHHPANFNSQQKLCLINKHFSLQHNLELMMKHLRGLALFKKDAGQGKLQRSVHNFHREWLQFERQVKCG